MTELLRLIISGNCFDGENVIDEIAHSLKAELHAEAYTCVIVWCEAKIDNMAAYQQRVAYFPTRCEAFFAKQGVRTVAWCGENGECVVILFGELPHNRLEKYLNDLHIYLQKHCESSIYIGASEMTQSISGLSSAYASAKNALRYRNPSDDTSVHYSRNVQMIYNSSLAQNSAEFERILRCFRLGELDQVRYLSTMYAEKIRAVSRKQEGDPYPTSIKRMFIELTVYVLHIASDAGVNVDDCLEHTDPYTCLMSISSTPRIIDWFMDVCVKMQKGITEKAHRKESGIVYRACEYIHSHLDCRELSLDSVSNYVSITPAYLSALFHKERGVGFSAYVMQARTDKAAELLKNTRLTVAQISQEVGFSTVNYFTRVFKKTKGVPPGVYRAQYQFDH